MPRWQREWRHLSEASKSRLIEYAGCGIHDLATMRLGTYVPRHPRRLVEFWNKLDSLIFYSAVKFSSDIRTFNSRVGPFAIRYARTPGYIGMPKDPVKWATRSGVLSGSVAESVAGVYRRNSLEHEIAELRLFRERAKRTKVGREYRAMKCLHSRDAQHNSVHPLISELNVSGRSQESLLAVMEDWSKSEGQNKIFSLMKQFGWTPVTGLPNFGKVSRKLQKRAEVIFGKCFRELIDTKIRRAERKYKGRALKKKKEELLDGASQLAGGRGLRKKYLK